MNFESNKDKILQLIPIVLLLIVASIHAYLWLNSSVSVWRLGSFGMYATVDDVAFRHMKVYAVFEKETQEFALNSSHERSLLKARVLPTEANLENLLNYLACDASLLTQEKADAIKLEYWTSHFNVENLSFFSEKEWEALVSKC